MKRVITLLLAFVLMISMCACGSKELSAEERERIYQEVAAEKAEAENADSENANVENANAENANFESANKGDAVYNVNIEPVFIPNGDRVTQTRNSDNNGLAEELPEPLGDENFVVEACKTVMREYDYHTSMDIYVKIRNLTEYSPPYKVGFYSTIIDENGDALGRTFMLGSTEIAPSGTAQWLDGYGEIEDGAAGIRILGYHVFENGEVLKQYFDKPIDLYSKDYKVSYEEIKGTGH